MATIVPEPLTPREAPVPTSIAADVLVPPSKEEKFPPKAEITPPLIVIVLPSGFTHPSWEVVDVVHLITPAVIVVVDPSPSKTPKAEEVA